MSARSYRKKMELKAAEARLADFYMDEAEALLVKRPAKTSSRQKFLNVAAERGLRLLSREGHEIIAHGPTFLGQPRPFVAVDEGQGTVHLYTREDSHV